MQLACEKGIMVQEASAACSVCEAWSFWQDIADRISDWAYLQVRQ